MAFQVIFPAKTTINDTIYDIPVQFYCNDTIRTKMGQSFEHTFDPPLPLSGMGVAIELANAWLRTNPFNVVRNVYIMNKEDWGEQFEHIFELLNFVTVQVPGNIGSYTFADGTTSVAKDQLASGTSYRKQTWDYYTHIWLSSTPQKTFNISLYVPPEDSLKGDHVVSVPDNCANLYYAIFTAQDAITGQYNITKISCGVRNASTVNNSTFTVLADLINKSYEDLDSTILDSDPDNPYEIDPSTPGGGGGSGVWAGVDDVEKAEFPTLPTLSAASAGFITMYNPTNSQLHALANFLWSSAFDIDTFKKLFSDPMECIIGLGIIPVNPSLAGAKNVKFGDVDSGVSMSYLSNQFCEKDFGTVDIKEYVQSFLDYSPYVDISIYLPYIGFCKLNPDDVMGRSLHLKYYVDCLTGGCTACIYVSGRGVMYQFNGNCIANIPLTAINYSGAIQNAVSCVGAIATTALGAVSGNAPIAAAGVASIATNAANTAVNTKEHVQRSGSMGGASGLLAVQRPYVIIQRPRMCVPDELNKFVGNMVNITMKLQNCVGFTMIEQIRLDKVKAMQEEKAELLRLLKEGVIF